MDSRSSIGVEDKFRGNDKVGGNDKLFMKNKLFLLVLLILIGSLVLIFKSKSQSIDQKTIATPVKQERRWQIKSIDTMKYSRDLSLEKLNDPSFDIVINSQITAIKDLHATHVAIGTPYDEKFIPILKRWVKAARDNDLKVWFRGNFSGWQGWFGESRSLSRQKHLELTQTFIQNHPDLFRDGDIFSPCPECENGGPGDPRSNGDIDGHRKFLIDQRNTALEEFKNINKKVIVLDSMNYDVAKLVMDKETAEAMGGIVVIDHYVKTPERLESDVKKLAEQTGAKIILGEIGVPIPDIHGNLSDQEQAAWIEKALGLLRDEEELIGLNYWVSHGGSTKIFDDVGTPKPAAEILKKYFSLQNLD